MGVERGTYLGFKMDYQIENCKSNPVFISFINEIICEVINIDNVII